MAEWAQIHTATFQNLVKMLPEEFIELVLKSGVHKFLPM